MKIAILGAESTGKSQLAVALVAHLERRGLPAALVPEYLRQWCDERGRTPTQGEQGLIAHTQTEQIQRAASSHWVVADTTSLMTAVYSDFLFGDTSLYEVALQHQRRFDLTLVMALDLPWVADGLQRDGAHVREPIDALLRAALARADIGYAEVRGQGTRRTDSALDAIRAISGPGLSRKTGSPGRP